MEEEIFCFFSLQTKQTVLSIVLVLARLRRLALVFFNNIYDYYDGDYAAEKHAYFDGDLDYCYYYEDY